MQARASGTRRVRVVWTMTMTDSETVMRVPLSRGGVRGSLTVPPSKSLTQRAIVAAAGAGRPARVERPLDAEDSRLLHRALAGAGYRLRWEDDEIVSDGFGPRNGGTLQMGNNGTGTRFLIAQLAVTPGRWTVDGVERLRQRPAADLVAALAALGARIEAGPDGGLPVTVEGRTLGGGEVTLDPSSSSQFVSALLLLGARLPNGLTVHLSAVPPSRPYLDLTTEVLGAFGSRVVWADDRSRCAVEGGRLRPVRYRVEGDWSAAAFPLAAVAVAGGDVELPGLRPDSSQGDAVVLDVLERAGCIVERGPRSVAVSGPAGAPVTADLRDAPDLFPALAVVAAVHGGQLDGLAGLVHKESDRLSVMARHLGSLGFEVERSADRFVATGRRTDLPAPPPLWPASDHRIAMALAVAGTVIPGLAVLDPACVAKSWPSFWSDWNGLIAGAA